MRQDLYVVDNLCKCQVNSIHTKFTKTIYIGIIIKMRIIFYYLK